jgi:hypothetical protein
MIKVLALIVSGTLFLLPFFLVYMSWLSVKRIRCRGRYVWWALFAFIPAWGAYAYAGLAWFEDQLISPGFRPISSLALYLYLAVNLSWAISFSIILRLGFAFSVFVVPLVFIVGLGVMGLFGWAAAVGFWGRY